jgi:hypothetical protein
MSTGNVVTPAECNQLINESIAELYDILVESRGMDWYEKVPPQTFTTDGRNPALYSLATDFYQLILVEANMGGFTVPLMPYTRVEHGRLSQGPAQAGTLVTVSYVPSCPLLVNDTDPFDGLNGWEEYVIVDSAAKCLEKEESDAGPFYKRKAELTERIRRLAPDRDGGMPAKRQDVRRTPLSPFVSRPLPQYRIHGNTDISGATPPTMELLQGLPFGVIL